MDVNGDGLVDVVRSSALEMQTFFSLGRYPKGDGRFGHATLTGPETASFSDDPVSTCVPWSATPIQLGDADVRVADMNGDGLPDFVRVRSGQVFYWPGRGNGFWGTGERDDCPGGGFGQNRHVTMENAPNFGVVASGNLELADVNGDGLSDLVEVRFDAVDVYLNVDGNGWTDRQILSKVPIKPNSSNFVRFADMDGSGTVDIVWGQGYDYRYIDLAGGVRPKILIETANGLGKTTELEYSTSTKLMLDAAANGTPWATTMPLSVPVVVRTKVRDNLDKIGRTPGVYVTEYGYRDPVFEGRQREFRGFSIAETRTLGDANSPPATTRSTFLLGECQVAQNAFDVCKPEDRWRDNWREPLKGLPVLVETFDGNGVYLSTAHTTYELRQLYAGRDGRRVTAAFGIATESFAYDTAAFTPSSQTQSLDEVVVNVNGISQTETRSVNKRGTGAVKSRSRQAIDSYGNPSLAIADGCIEGCAQVDESITTHMTHAQPAGDASGWLFRPTASFVTGSVQTAPRREISHEYDAHGDLQRSKAKLSGTLPLDRSYAAGGAGGAGGAVAPPPPGASGGVSSPVDIVTIEYERDAFGNATSTRAPSDRCRSVASDPTFADLPLSESVYAGDHGASGCGTRVLTTTAEYDRGLALVTRVTDVSGEPARIDYDGFGRMVAKTFADPDAPGQLAALPSDTYAYSLPADASTSPYSTIVIRKQDGQSTTANEYLEQQSFIDGLGRSLASLVEADPSAGDQGNWIVSGIVDFDAKGAPFRAYESFFYTGAPQSFALNVAPTSGSTSQQYDAFGRAIATYGLDGGQKIANVYHALSRDVWDAEDLSPGSHQGTFATVAADGHGRTVRTTERIRVSGVLEERHMLRDFLPTGEVTRVVVRRSGSPDTIRWMRYDSLGRLVLNAEPNTSSNFSPAPTTDAATIKAWRYAYNDAGDLVGTSDARGCGVNYHFEAAGRLVAEDYSPCEAAQAPYTPVTSLATGAGTEVFNRYDLPDPESSSIVDAAGHTFPINAAALVGRVASVSDRGGKSAVRYDSRGRPTGTAVKITAPGGADPAIPSSYAPRWYVQDRSFDAADRPIKVTTGATVSELLGASSESATTMSYSQRGAVVSIGSSYGTLVNSRTFAADGLITSVVLGDLAATQRAYSYDQLRRLRSVQAYRAGPGLWTSPSYAPATDPTQQLLLEDYDFSYDEVGNLVEVKDWRIAAEWPTGSQPVDRKFEYDDLYRLTRARYDCSGGGDAWISPFAGENADPSPSPQPSPHVSFAERVKDQRYAYDHLGNTILTTDDASGFLDRSLGNVSNGTSSAGPHQLTSASNRALSPTSPRKGDLSAAYDAAGNLVTLITRRDGPCLPSGASCWQRFAYRWDELGRLADARRWDLAAGTERADHGDLTDPVPNRPPDVLLRHQYDSSGQRVLKTAVDPTGAESHTVYVFPTLEIRRATWSSSGGALDYTLNSQTESVLLPATGVRARVVYAEEDFPNQTSGHQHVFLELDDHLGSTTSIIDRATGELVEQSTYMAYGRADSDYRPARWGKFREPYKFTGKEEDVEVGLQYFGARYLVVGLGRWASPDSVWIHAGRGDSNPFAYVGGRPTRFVDPDGRLAIVAAVAIGILVGAVIAGGTSASVQYAQTGSLKQVNWGWKGVGGAALAGGIGGGLSAGLGAAGAGVWAGAAGGAASSATSAGTSGASSGGILVAGGLGAVGGLAGGAVSGLLNDAALSALEPTGVGLSTAIGLSAASSSIVSGAAMGVAVEGIRGFGGADVDYGRAAGIGAATGAAGFAGSAVSGGLVDPGPAFDTPEGATRYGNWQNQSVINARSAGGQKIREAGSVQYEWGGKYYSGGTVVSSSGEGSYENEVLAGSSVPSGATTSGFSHGHPPPTVLQRTFGAVDESYRGWGGFHKGDKFAADGSWVDAGRPAVWVEGISTPSGKLEFYYPRTGRSYVQPSLSGLPSWR